MKRFWIRLMNRRVVVSLAITVLLLQFQPDVTTTDSPNGQFRASQESPSFAAGLLYCLTRGAIRPLGKVKLTLTNVKTGRRVDVYEGYEPLNDEWAEPFMPVWDRDSTRFAGIWIQYNIGGVCRFRSFQITSNGAIVPESVGSWISDSLGQVLSSENSEIRSRAHDALAGQTSNAGPLLVNEKYPN